MFTEVYLEKPPNICDRACSHLLFLQKHSLIDVWLFLYTLNQNILPKYKPYNVTNKIDINGMLP